MEKEKNLEKLRNEHFPEGFIPNTFYPQGIVKDYKQSNLIEGDIKNRLNNVKVRVENYLENSPDIDNKIVQHLKNAEVCEGMITHQVKLIWEEPLIIHENTYEIFNADEIWEYHIIWYIVHLYVKDDKVIRIIPLKTDIMY